MSDFIREGVSQNSISRIYKTRDHNGSYLLLLGKEKLQSFEISHE